MSQLREISGGQISGTGTIPMTARVLGGVNIVADGTNACTVLLRKNDSSGDVIFQVQTKSPYFPVAPILLDADEIYYSITGTNGTAELYEWVE